MSKLVFKHNVIHGEGKKHHKFGKGEECPAELSDKLQSHLEPLAEPVKPAVVVSKKEAK